jgi:hypothetical protein
VVALSSQNKARANMIIQKIRDGTIMDMPERSETKANPAMPDPVTGQPTVQVMQVPGWMPREFDDVEVQSWVFAGWMKTTEAASLPPDRYEVAMLIYQGLEQLKSQKQAQAAAAQTAQAEELGASNAAKPQPQEAKPMPSTPSPTGPAEGP